MVTTNTSSPPPMEFRQAVAQLGSYGWRAGMQVEEIGSPQRIAPHSVAIAADFTEHGEVLSNGRLILLHDPLGNEAWEGTFRVVSFVRADVEMEMVADPLLPEVAWSWLTEALEHRTTGHTLLAGTVTASYGRSFGNLDGTEDQAEVEIRASWTPVWKGGQDFDGHLLAWEELLGFVAGRPPLPRGVVQFPGSA